MSTPVDARELGVLDWIDYVDWLTSAQWRPLTVAWDARCRGPLGRWARDGIPSPDHAGELRDLHRAGVLPDLSRVRA